jgi:protein TonB
MSAERGMSREVVRWLISGAIVLSLHGGAAAVLATWTEPMPPGAPEAAILLDLSSAAAAPSAPQSDAAPSRQDSQAAEATPEPVKPVEKEQLEPVKQTAELHPEKEPPKEIVQPQPETIPDIPPEPPVTKPAEVVLPKPAPPPPQAKPVQKKQKVASVDSRRVHQERVADKVSSAVSGANAAAIANYNQQVLAHIQRHKKYAANLQNSNVQGSVAITFRLNRAGNIVSSHISRGSGNSSLDQEALSMLRRAQPFPTPPSEVAESQLLFNAPLSYTIR